MNAHNSITSTFLLDTTHSSTHAIFAFPGSWSLENWFSHKPFGSSDIDRTLFPSLRSVGNAKTAVVIESFLRQFQTILRDSNLQEEVRKAVAQNKRMVFTGHSSGGAVAILATIWLLEHYKQKKQPENAPVSVTTENAPFCVTFGSPLIGDRVFGHAVRRENWDHLFIHFVTRYDIVPRISLAPLSSIERELPAILCFFNPKSTYFRQEAVGRAQEAAVFFSTVMKNASSVTSHAALLCMGSTNLILNTLPSFVELSPYKPFGTYIFCTGSGKMVTVKNPDAVLQIFFHCLQLNPGEDIRNVAYRSLQDHFAYKPEVQGGLQRQDIIYLDNMEHIPLSRDTADSNEKRLIDMALDTLGLSTKARNCLRAAGKLEKQNLQNQDKIDSNFSKIEEGLNMLYGYRATCEVLEVGYFDAFKLQKTPEDFNANVKRLELAGMWDEIIEMLKRYELPDGFEARKQWVELGTKYRRLVEPLDIANYYRHNKNDDTGPYMIMGRPRRYRFTQRWLEHYCNMSPDSCLESCFWAEVEELCRADGSKFFFQDTKERVLRLESEIERWVSHAEITQDVFLEESTFVKWWRKLPDQHRAASRITRLMDEIRKNIPNSTS
ncbi:Enhanced disease susceptibility [Thalictrum thalictroides]|uniref:Enhanced disease susceptibility n=1 Tax=Thalictrum thalictroides TaxID=46969 RepID=A0A7J6X5G3_THATH|nr:Enhanced disease susceptibility [Thalictrum thalictroides]